MRTIVEVEYKREERFTGLNSSGFDYMQNVITFNDGSKEIRLGVTRVYGKNINEMRKSLVIGMNQLKGTSHWWSLQVTDLNELKAAYRAGFRNRELSSLESHIKTFNQHGGTLHVEINR